MFFKRICGVLVVVAVCLAFFSVSAAASSFEVKRLPSTSGIGWQLFAFFPSGSSGLLTMIDPGGAGEMKNKNYGVTQQIWYSSDKRFLLFEFNYHPDAVPANNYRGLYLLEKPSGSYFRIFSKVIDPVKSEKPSWVGKNKFSYHYRWTGRSSEGGSGDLVETLTVIEQPSLWAKKNEKLPEARLYRIALAFTQDLLGGKSTALKYYFACRGHYLPDFYASRPSAQISSYDDVSAVLGPVKDFFKNPNLAIVGTLSGGAYGDSRVIIADTRKSQIALDVYIKGNSVIAAFGYYDSNH